MTKFEKMFKGLMKKSSFEDFFYINKDDQQMVIRNLVLSYGVYDTVRQLQDCLDRMWYLGKFSVDVLSTDIDNEHIYIEYISIDICSSGNIIPHTVIIPCGIILRKGGYITLQTRVEERDRIEIGNISIRSLRPGRTVYIV